MFQDLICAHFTATNQCPESDWSKKQPLISKQPIPISKEGFNARCPECSEEVDDISNFCSKCDRKVEAEASLLKEAAEQVKRWISDQNKKIKNP